MGAYTTYTVGTYRAAPVVRRRLPARGQPERGQRDRRLEARLAPQPLACGGEGRSAAGSC